MPHSSKPANDSEQTSITKALTPGSSQFDWLLPLVELAADVLNAPDVRVILQGDSSLQGYAHAGDCPVTVSREVLEQLIAVGEDLLVVDDLAADPRFDAGASVTSPCFCALETLWVMGHCIGHLLVLNPRSVRFSRAQQKRLSGFARQIEQFFRMQQQIASSQLQSQNDANRSAYYDAVFRTAAAGMVRVNRDGFIMEANPYVGRMLGLSVRELQGQCLFPYLPSIWPDDSAQVGLAVVESIVGVETTMVTARQSEFPVHLSISQIALDVPSQLAEYLIVITDLSDTRQAEMREQEERMLLRSVIEGSPDPIYARAPSGRYLIANSAALKQIGQSAADGSSRILSELEQSVVDSCTPVTTHKSTTDGRRIETKHSPLIDSAGKVCGVIGIEHDVSKMLRLSNQVEREQKLLSVLHRGLTDYQALISGNTLWDFLMEALRELTNSEFALIGELVPDEDDKALKIHAITDLSWSAESRTLMAGLKSGDMRLTNPDTLLGRVFAGGEVVLSNDLSADRQHSAFPPGHPPLRRYLGVPIMNQGKQLGMFAIANGADDYNDDLVSWLEPFTSTCALLINLYRGLDERERITMQLRSEGDKAERASRAKSEFLSSMSHELRTPLNSILGFAQLLKTSKSPMTERQTRQVEQIYSSGKHLLELINDVLDLAKIESGKINLAIEEIHLDAVLADAVEILGPIADAKGIQLTIDHGSDIGQVVMADFMRLKQIFINLVTNAIKYNRDNGSVIVRRKLVGEMLEMSVEDTGIGIPEQKIDQLFQPFNRLGAESGPIEGTGIGLALTRRLVMLMGGEIGLSSESGVGSRFWFRLPIGASDALVDDDYDADTMVTALKSHLVLYIEDSPANQRLMEDIFEDVEDCTLEIAPSAEMGLEIACAKVPDIILMDIDLPGIDGFQAQMMLRQNPITRHIPVIGVSAGAYAANITRANQAGFHEYLTKPVDIPRLLSLVEELLNKGGR